MSKLKDIRYDSILKGALQRASYRMTIFLTSRMGKDSGSAYDYSAAAPSGSNKINIMTGNLLRSFQPKNKQNVSIINYSNGAATWTFGSKLKYASIHEKGGFVKSKGKMHKYFWAKYYESKNPYMKNLALGVKKAGGINIKARPYFAAAFEDFERMPDGLSKTMNEIIIGIKNEFDKIENFS